MLGTGVLLRVELQTIQEDDLQSIDVFGSQKASPLKSVEFPKAIASLIDHYPTIKMTTQLPAMKDPSELPKMQYVRLGKSGLKVSRLIFGCATYGTKSDVAWRIEEEEALKHLKVCHCSAHS